MAPIRTEEKPFLNTNQVIEKKETNSNFEVPTEPKGTQSHVEPNEKPGILSLPLVAVINIVIQIILYVSCSNIINVTLNI
jgi:hypothetical protein